MATAIIQPPNIHSFTQDASSGASIYTTNAHNRFTANDFIYQSSIASQKQDTSIKPNSPSGKKPTKEFKVTRKNSYRGPNYYRINSIKRPASHSPKTSPNHKRQSKFENLGQIEPVLDLFSDKSAVENPSYMVQYFSKKLDLLKKNPDIHYKILKAELKINDTSKETTEAMQKLSKQRKYQSLPIIGSKSEIELNKKQRQSAPVSIVYKPTDLSINEYLNTPLDFYQHRQQKSISSTITKSDGTKSTNRYSAKSGDSNDSVAASISTSALYQQKITQKSSYRHGKGRSLATKRKDSVVKRRYINPEDFNDENELLNDKDIELKRKVSIIQQEKYLNKFGTPILKTNIGKASFGNDDFNKKKRESNCGAVSIATGNEIYDEMKTTIFNQKFSNWTEVLGFIKKEYPDLSDNSYFLARLMLEIYLRRVLAARIALKLGSDRSKKGVSDVLWIGLKESIAAVYGVENAEFFESHNDYNMYGS